MSINKLRTLLTYTPASKSASPVTVTIGLLIIIGGSFFAAQSLGWIYFAGLFFIVALFGLIWTEKQTRPEHSDEPVSVNSGRDNSTLSTTNLRTKEPFISDLDEFEADINTLDSETNVNTTIQENSKHTLELHDPGEDPVSVMRILQDKLGFSATKSKQIIVEKNFPIILARGDKRDLTVKSLLLKKSGAKVKVNQETMPAEQTTSLRAIGYWITLITDRQFYPPHDFIGEYEPGVKELMVDYLDSGEIYKHNDGMSWCRFNCGIPDSKMGNSELTDGLWVWPEGLSHYVQEHDVLLPDDFINHVISGGSQVSERPDPGIEPDFGFWLTWCKEHSSGKGSQLINKAREHAESLGKKGEALLKKYRNKRASLVEDAIGLSDVSCQVKGCQRHALTGTSFCAEHHMNPFMDKSGFKPDAEFFELSKKHKQFHDALGKFTDLKYVLNRQT